MSGACSRGHEWTNLRTVQLKLFPSFVSSKYKELERREKKNYGAPVGRICFPEKSTGKKRKKKSTTRPQRYRRYRTRKTPHSTVCNTRIIYYYWLARAYCKRHARPSIYHRGVLDGGKVQKLILSLKPTPQARCCSAVV